LNGGQQAVYSSLYTPYTLQDYRVLNCASGGWSMAGLYNTRVNEWDVSPYL